MSEIQLMQGDCLEKMKAIPDKSIDMILCDLPYGTTSCKWDNVIPFEPMWEQYNRIIKPNGAICLFGSEPFSSALRMSNIKHFKYDWIWNKKKAANYVLAKKQPLKVHEIISVFNSSIYKPQKKKGKFRKKGGYIVDREVAVAQNPTVSYNDEYYPKSILTDFTTANNKNSRLHPTQKSIELLEYLIRTYTNEGETVLDNCMGSGSTGVACINTNRNFIGIELDEGYFNIAKERIDKAVEDKQKRDE